eukprot:1771433-Alexandrium_andersonii.AAC.1
MQDTLSGANGVGRPLQFDRCGRAKEGVKPSADAGSEGGQKEKAEAVVQDTPDQFDCDQLDIMSEFEAKLKKLGDVKDPIKVDDCQAYQEAVTTSAE